jgi:exodeoxyribonuclease VII large subunit
MWLDLRLSTWQAPHVLPETRNFATVSRVHARLRKLLEPALNAKAFWLRAELSSVNHSKGRLYCDLVELRDGRVIAKFRCTIWPRELADIKSRLQDARLDELLEDGNEVGLRCQIQYHELYGMSVNAVDIDPSASLGALERKKQEIIARLQADQLLDKNAEHPVPALPKRIGLVASRDTAGYKDFVTTLEASGYGITVFAADARVEGDDTERTVLRALDTLSRLDLDLVVILRGGGSRISLSYLDNEAIARAIAKHPRPVWTAIGHEIDTSVLDAVAHTSYKTPTAVAEQLVSRFASAEEALQVAATSMRSLVELRIRPERTRVDGAGERLVGLASRALRERRAEGEAGAKTFRLLVHQRLGSEDARLVNARGQLLGLAKQRRAIAGRALDEHHKSLHKTIGRALDRRRDARRRLQERLVSPTALNRLRNESQRSAAWSRILRAADPARNLERGYALVYDAEGTLLRTTESLEIGQKIRTKLGRGVVVSSVQQTEKSHD